MKTTIPLLLAVLSLAYVEADVDMNSYKHTATQELFGRVLHFESKADRGVYINFDGLSFLRDMNLKGMAEWFVLYYPRDSTKYGCGNMWPLCSHITESDIYTTPMTMFKFEESDDPSWGVIESVVKPGYYLTTMDYWQVKKPMDMRKKYAKDNDHYRYQVRCKDDTYNDCIVVQKSSKQPISFVSCRLSIPPSYLDKHRTCISAINDNPRMIIHAPNPSERWIEIDRLYNRQSTPLQYTIRYKEGFSSTKTVTSTQKVSVSVEISAAFKVFSAKTTSSFEQTWQTMNSETFTSEHERTIKVTVEPNKILYVRQLTGSYGPFTVKSKVLEFSNDPNFSNPQRSDQLA